MMFIQNFLMEEMQIKLVDSDDPLDAGWLLSVLQVKDYNL